MAILIPDMEMPKNCMDCDLQYDMCACILTGTRFWTKDTFDPATEKLSECPIVEVDMDIKLFTVLAEYCKHHTIKEFKEMNDLYYGEKR